MATTNCPECGHTISTHSIRCPGCGRRDHRPVLTAAFWIAVIGSAIWYFFVR